MWTTGRHSVKFYKAAFEKLHMVKSVTVTYNYCIENEARIVTITV